MRIREIKRKPWWKFWTLDQWEVTVELDSSRKKTVMIYDSDAPLLSLGQHSLDYFLEYVRNKVLYGTQWDHEVQRRLDKKQHKDKTATRLRGLVGARLSEQNEPPTVTIPKSFFKEDR